MEEKLLACLNTLELVSVSGHEDLNRMLGVMQTLNQLILEERDKAAKEAKAAQEAKEE